MPFQKHQISYSPSLLFFSVRNPVFSLNFNFNFNFSFSSIQAFQLIQFDSLMEKMMIKHLIFEMGSVTYKILIETIVFFTKTITYLSSSNHFASNNPLFSIVIALYSLILLYFPRIFLEVIFSPVLISTGILLSTLLRLGSIQRTTIEEEVNHHHHHLGIFLDEDLDHNWVIKEEEEETEMGFSPKKIFVEWNVRAPLEVIYEEYEGQEEENEMDEENREMGISGLGSLGRYYPESDTESSSDGDFPGTDQGWNSPENMCFRWEEEDKEDGLIEIELDDDNYKRFKEDCDDDDDDDDEFLQVEEENLIEIEISPFGSPMNKWKEFKQRQRGSDLVNLD